jgi:hypothetical protein
MNYSSLDQYNHNDFSFDNTSFFDKKTSTNNISSYKNHPEFDVTQTTRVKTQKQKKSKSGHMKNLDYAKAALRGSFSDDFIQDNELISMYFSNENVNRIQSKIKKEISDRTNGKYAVDVDQNIEDLLVVMGHIMIEDGQFLLAKIVKQVKSLNKKVVDYVVPDMINEISQNYGYQQEINKPLQPMMRPMNVNNAGRKTLPSMTTMWTH